MAVTQEQVQEALAGVVDANTGRDLVAGKSVKAVRVEGAAVAVDIVLAYPAKTQLESMRTAVEARLQLAASPVEAHLRVRHRDPELGRDGRRGQGVDSVPAPRSGPRSGRPS